MQVQYLFHVQMKEKSQTWRHTHWITVQLCPGAHLTSVAFVPLLYLPMCRYIQLLGNSLLLSCLVCYMLQLQWRRHLSQDLMSFKRWCAIYVCSFCGSILPFPSQMYASTFLLLILSRNGKDIVEPVNMSAEWIKRKSNHRGTDAMCS